MGLFSTKEPRRTAIERKTIKAMLSIFCHGHHGTAGELCKECGDLLDYAFRRLDRCPFRPAKPTCANCKIHCYKPEFRDKVRQVMRYAGPRMARQHPILALFHILEGQRVASGRSE